jgi:hypothetical protein
MDLYVESFAVFAGHVLAACPAIQVLLQAGESIRGFQEISLKFLDPGYALELRLPVILALQLMEQLPYQVISRLDFRSRAFR